jgi:hypothetical protein
MVCMTRTHALIGIVASLAASASVLADSLLYSQPLWNNGGTVRMSQLWQDPTEQNDSDNDAIAWENFTLPHDSTITQVRWWGQSPPPNGFLIEFFRQDPNTVAVQPDIFGANSEPIYSQFVPAPAVQGAGSMYQFTATLDQGVSLPGGTRYFVSIVGLMPVPYTSWGWAQGSNGVSGTFWWQRGAHMYFQVGDDRALELYGNEQGGGAALKAHDPFAGPFGLDLHGAQGGVGWTTPWQDVAYDTVSVQDAEGLTYPGLDCTAGSVLSEQGMTSYPISGYARTFGAMPSGVNQVYVSFLMREELGSMGWGGVRFGTYPYAMLVGVPSGMYAFGMMTSEGAGDVSNVSMGAGQTHLVVVRIAKTGPGGSLVYRMYVDPVVGSVEPASPLAQYGTMAVTALPTSLMLMNGGGWRTDEVRVGSTWESVLPAAPACVGDLTHDQVVNGGDLGTLLAAWGTAAADLDGNGTTDGSDLGALLAAWGPCP